MSIKIDQALTQAYVSGGFNIATAYENAPFTPTAGTPHAIVEIIRNSADPITLGAGGVDETTGLLQIRLRYPVNSGAHPAKSKADEMMMYFRIGRVFVYEGQRVQIVSKDRGSGRNDEGWYQLVLRFEFNARTLRAAA